MGDAEITDAAGFFPFAQHRQVGFEVEQVVHLHQVYGFGLQQAERIFHLADASVASGGPDLGGEEQRRPYLQPRRQRAGRGFGIAVHRR